eukprot:1337816-Pleurochrysis_carterae.AAC.1
MDVPPSLPPSPPPMHMEEVQEGPGGDRRHVQSQRTSQTTSRSIRGKNFRPASALNSSAVVSSPVMILATWTRHHPALLAGGRLTLWAGVPTSGFKCHARTSRRNVCSAGRHR